MKTQPFSFARLALILALGSSPIFFAGCNAVENSEEIGKALIADGTTLSAQVDGKTWSSDLGAYYIPWGKGRSITAMSGLTEMMTLTVDSSAVGEYKVSEKTSFAIALQKGDATYLARKGVIHITKCTADIIEGDFEGELQEDTDGMRKYLQITKGKFKAKAADKSLSHL